MADPLTQKTKDAIQQAKSTPSKNPSTRLVRISVVERMIGQMVDNALLCPLGKVDEMLEEFKAALPEALRQAEHKG